jgi:hypothetical protein
VCDPEKANDEPFFFNKEVCFLKRVNKFDELHALTIRCLTTKQVQYFDNPNRYKQGIDFYAKRYAHCLDEGLGLLRLDATPNTIEHAERVHETYTQPAAGDLMSRLKIILLVREPIDRELSLYNHKVFNYKAAEKRGWINGTWYRDVVHKSDGSIKTFTEYCELVKEYMTNGAPTYTISRYVEHLQKWANLFDRKQILVLNYDELQTNPSKVQWRIEQFLESKFDGTLARTNDSSSSSKVKEIPESAVKLLYPVFHDLNLELYEWLDKNPGPDMEQRPFPPFVEHFVNSTPKNN